MEKKKYYAPVICFFDVKSSKILAGSEIEIIDTETGEWGDAKDTSWEDDDDLDGGSAIW